LKIMFCIDYFSCINICLIVFCFSWN